MENVLEKLVLGTVQFGLDYGINNLNGKPVKEKSLEMLDFAYRNGIKIFDTAFNYGDAEEILGEFLQNHNFDKEIKIITKLKANIISELSGGVAYDIVFANLKESLKRLKRDYVEGYLFHTPAYIKDNTLVNSLRKLKGLGLVKNIGVSVYEEEDATYAAKLNEVDYIQVPYSIFDQRLDKTDFFQIAKKNGKTVFARSTFLQGLFFMPEEKIPLHLENAKGYLRDLDKIINKYNLSRQQTALLFSLKNKNIDYVVFGVDNIEQLKEDIDIAQQNIDCEECIEELKNKFINIEKNIIFPSLWKK
ncbi:MAG: aldo/keto reductase [Candidatus Staskawiczbacteria bacterium]|jgi:aryl-alcohol dehydrogenase-like predicted oxidoreductase